MASRMVFRLACGGLFSVLAFWPAASHAGLSYQDTVLADGPAGYWRLGDAAAPVVDLVAAKNGSITGGVTTGQPGAIAGDADTSMLFDGSTGYVQVPYDAAHNPGSFSVEVWGRMLGGNGMSLWRAPVSARGGNANGGTGFNIYGGNDDLWQFWIGRDKVAGGGTSSWSIVKSSTAPVVIGDWTHLVGTYDGGTGRQKFYVDGRLIGQATEPFFQTNTSTALRFGTLGSFYFDGDVDEAALYPQPLRKDQLAAHYATGRLGQGFAGPSADLMVFHFDEGHGSETRDAGLNYVVGTLQNSPTWSPGCSTTRSPTTARTGTFKSTTSPPGATPS